jgi:glycerophosphoryl diester phosphodiesterase
MASGPLVIAHRGSSQEFPEHSIAAYRRAIDLGADGVECDVRLTRDGHLVLVHDSTVDRTSNGHGAIADMTLQELEWFDFDRVPGTPVERVVSRASKRRWADRTQEENQRVPTLQALLQLLLDSERPVSISIETKHPHRFSKQLEAATFALLHRMKFPLERVRIMSFSARGLARAHAISPNVPLVYLEEFLPVRRLDGRLPAHVTIAGPGIALIREHPELVENVHVRGSLVHVWTVDTRADLDFCVSLGVDAVISNRPGDMLAYLGRSVAR